MNNNNNNNNTKTTEELKQEMLAAFAAWEKIVNAKIQTTENLFNKEIDGLVQKDDRGSEKTVLELRQELKRYKRVEQDKINRMWKKM